MKNVTVSNAKCTCIFDGKTQALKAVLCSPWMSLITPHWTCLRVAWVENLQKHSCKCKSWAIWALSTLPALCGEKEFLNSVNQRGRVGAMLCLYSCSLGSCTAIFQDPEVSVLGEDCQRLEEVRTGVWRWLSSKCSWLLIVNSFQRKRIFIKNNLISIEFPQFNI